MHFQDEWQAAGRLTAQRAAIAEFESHCASKGIVVQDGPAQGHISYSAITSLYRNPSDLSVVQVGCAVYVGQRPANRARSWLRKQLML